MFHFLIPSTGRVPSAQKELRACSRNHEIYFYVFSFTLTHEWLYNFPLSSCWLGWWKTEQASLQLISWWRFKVVEITWLELRFILSQPLECGWAIDLRDSWNDADNENHSNYAYQPSRSKTSKTPDSYICSTLLPSVQVWWPQ